MNKDEFIKAGYVNFGYISPELSSESTYPEYIKKNADMRKRKKKTEDTKI